jgi:2-aminoethylphosphonate-pyruvate transaminase
MSSHIKKAVILAAGLGLRLRDVMQGYPKGFLAFGEKPIIEESIDKLLKFGINEILIVTGYADGFYEGLKEKYDCIRTIKSDIFSSSGSLYSLYLAKDLIHEDFLLLESDLIYEKRALLEIIRFPQEDCILLSGLTYSGDEIFIGASGNVITHMSKDRTAVPNIVGELVGISKISYSLYRKIIEISEELFETTLQLDYEVDGIMEAATRMNVHYKVIDDLASAEIDNANHYERAKNIVYPLIQERDANTSSVHP